MHCKLQEQNNMQQFFLTRQTIVVS